MASFFLMKPVFIQPWTIPRKYLRSANLPKAMSQTAAMKMSDFYQKRLTAQEIMMHLPRLCQLACFLLFSQQQWDTWYPCCGSAAINIPSPASLAFPSVQHSKMCVLLLTLQCCISWYNVFLNKLFMWVDCCCFSATGLCDTFFVSLTFVCIVATGMRLKIWFVYYVIKY